ncbi:MAG: radical SAM protein [Pseudomonadota bacterium]
MTAPRPFDDGLQRFLRGELSGRDLLAKPTISTVSVLLTYQCPARCDHCVFSSGPRRKETVDAGLARRFLRAAARQEPPPLVSFSGGDPFARLPLMTELATLCRDLGLSWEVISSSAWCTSSRRGDEIFARLAPLGLRTYCTSVDPYHTAHVDPARLRGAVAAARSHGIAVLINTVSRLDGGEEAYVARTLGMDDGLPDGVKVNCIKVVPIGRAAEKVTDYLYRDGDEMREGCPYATEVVPLSPNGRLYSCCGMVVQDGIADNPFALADLGGADEDAIAEVLAGVKQDLFFRLLQTVGPYQLLRRLAQRHPGLALPGQFVGGCDACCFLMNSPQAVTALWDYLTELSGELTYSAASSRA